MKYPDDDSQELFLARKFAVEAHGAQLYGDRPYSYHLDRVHDVLVRFGQTQTELLTAGILHDVIEDTATNYSDVKLGFGFEVAELVYAVTDELGRNRQERHAKTYPKIKALSGAIVLKLADRIANVEHSVAQGDDGKLSMYRKEQEGFRTGVGPAGPHLMWAHLDRLLA